MKHICFLGLMGFVFGAIGITAFGADIRESDDYIEITSSGCGNSALSTNPNGGEFRELAACYQEAMKTGMHGKNKTETAKAIAFRVCGKFRYNFSQIDCISRFSAASGDSILAKILDACKDQPKTGLWATAQYAATYQCLQDEQKKYPDKL